MEREGEPKAAVGARDAAVAAVAAAAVGGLAAADGGFFPQSWGWAALGLLWAAGAAIALGRPALARLDLVALGLLAAAVAWTLLSVLWSESVPLSALEAERGLVYVAALGTFLLLGRPRALLAGTLVGIAAVAAANLVLRVPGVMGGEAEPVGYANGLAFLAAIGVVLAVGLAPWGLLAVPLLLPVLVAMDSRGGWLALAVGLVATVAPRLRLAVLLAGLVFALATGMTVGSQRPEYWPVAYEQWTGAPAVGTGAGTFPRVWLRERESLQVARDAHNLYLETLAEQGLVGFALLAAALAVPLVPRPRLRPAVGVYVAFLVHAALDWDWEQAALTVAALAAAAALLGGRDLLVPRARALAGAAILGAVAVLVTVGNSAVAQSADAAAASGWDASARWARIASRAAPWAAQPWHRLAEAERARGRPAEARRALREALERDPGDPDLWVALAGVTSGHERRAALERAARLNPLGSPR